MEMGRAPGMMQGASEEAPEPMGDESGVSPEEQQSYDAFVGNALSLIAKNPKIKESVKKTLSAGDPIESLATATLSVVSRLEQSAQGKGVELSADVLMHGGLEITEHLAELAAASKIHEYDEAEVEGAFYRAVDMYREQNQGNIDQKGLKEDFDQMVAADQQGQLDQVVPGATQAAQALTEEDNGDR